MDPSTMTGIGGAFAAFFAGAYAYFQQRKAIQATALAVTATASATRNSSDELAKSQLELTASYQAMAADWKKRYEVEHDELQKYGDYVHDKAKEDQAAMLTLTKENANLRARTDLTPIVEQMKALGEMLGKLTQAVGVLMDRVSEIEGKNP